MTAVIHHGDCVDWLRSLPPHSVSHTITDPPYEAEAHSKQRRLFSTRTGMRPAPLDFPAITEAERWAVSREIVRVTRGWALVFCQAEGLTLWRDALVAAGAKYRRAGVWIKPNPTPQLSGDRPGTGYEIVAIVWCGRGRSIWNGGGKPAVWTHLVQKREQWGRAGHPTEKPVPLMAELVSLFTQPGDLVCDPYAGSGSTGVACLRTGRNFTGAERDVRWVALALERFAAESAGSTLAGLRAGQQPLFGGDQ